MTRDIGTSELCTAERYAKGDVTIHGTGRGEKPIAVVDEPELFDRMHARGAISSLQHLYALQYATLRLIARHHQAASLSPVYDDSRGRSDMRSFDIETSRQVDVFRGVLRKLPYDTWQLVDALMDGHAAMPGLIPGALDSVGDALDDVRREIEEREKARKTAPR